MGDRVTKSPGVGWALRPGHETCGETTNEGSTQGIGERATSEEPREGHIMLVPWTRDMAQHLERSVAIQLDAERHVTRVLAETPRRERSETNCCTCRWKSCRRNSPFGAVVISGSPRGDSKAGSPDVEA